MLTALHTRSVPLNYYAVSLWYPGGIIADFWQACSFPLGRMVSLECRRNQTPS